MDRVEGGGLDSEIDGMASDYEMQMKEVTQSEMGSEIVIRTGAKGE